MLRFFKFLNTLLLKLIQRGASVKEVMGLFIFIIYFILFFHGFSLVVVDFSNFCMFVKNFLFRVLRQSILTKSLSAKAQKCVVTQIISILFLKQFVKLKCFSSTGSKYIVVFNLVTKVLLCGVILHLQNHVIVSSVSVCQFYY